MSVLIIKNIKSEGPGTIESFLRERLIGVTLSEAVNLKDIGSLDGYDTLVVMGGPQAVYEMGPLAPLREAARLTADAIQRGMKVLGVCLGAQLIAHVLGARVYKGVSGQEMGWHEVQLTDDGMNDNVMAALGSEPCVFHWHGDTFELPEGARRLAGSSMYPNQAFAYGQNVYALQFHIEATEAMVAGWFKDDDEMARQAAAHAPVIAPKAEQFYERFFLD